MKSPKSSGKPKGRRKLLIVRRVTGISMMPGLWPGQIIIGVRVAARKLHAGQVVIINHDGLEKVKRIRKMRFDQVFVLGDNPDGSTDSRSFGWVPIEAVRARVVWPRC